MMTQATEAGAALNLLRNLSTSMSRSSIWDALRPRAVKASDEKLEFADGSSLLFNTQTAGYLAI
jgi:hypothetical protein